MFSLNSILLLTVLARAPILGVEMPDFVKYHWSGGEFHLTIEEPKFKILNYQFRTKSNSKNLNGYLQTGPGIRTKYIETVGLFDYQITVIQPLDFSNWNKLVKIDWQYFIPELLIYLPKNTRITGRYFIALKEEGLKPLYPTLEFRRQNINPFVQQVGGRIEFKSPRTYVLFSNFCLLPKKENVLQNTSLVISYNRQSGFRFSASSRNSF